MKQVFTDRDELLIAIYVDICDFYKASPEYQELFETNSPNKKQRFTDLELIACVLFGKLTNNDEKKEIYDYIKAHYKPFFPNLPSYSCFVKRLNRLHEAIFYLLNYFMCCSDHISGDYYIIDSFPVIVAKAHHKLKSEWAEGRVAKGYKSSKKLWFYGVNVHTVANASLNRKLPQPEYMAIDTANEFDLNVAKQMLPELEGFEYYADLAYRDTVFVEELKNYNASTLKVPEKKPKGGILSLFQQAANTIHSSLRQPIEILFAMNDRFTKIQDAHLVRSYSGLLLHICLNIVVFFIDYFCFSVNC
jgi:hypothetical protein